MNFEQNNFFGSVVKGRRNENGTQQRQNVCTWRGKAKMQSRHFHDFPLRLFCGVRKNSDTQTVPFLPVKVKAEVGKESRRKRGNRKGWGLGTNVLYYTQLARNSNFGRNIFQRIIHTCARAYTHTHNTIFICATPVHLLTYLFCLDPNSLALECN